MTSVPLVQNFTLPGDIYRKFSLDWSADNKIAVCTNKAIYILQSYSSAMEVGFPTPLHKQVIPVPELPMQLNPVTIPSNPYKFIETYEDRENLFNVLMDHTLNPTPPERAANFRTFRCCRWSPKGAASSSRCLLAALTMDHRLVLYEENEKEWRSLCDLTELLKEQHLMDKAAAREAKREEAKALPKRNKSKGRGRKSRRSVGSGEEETKENSDKEFVPDTPLPTNPNNFFKISETLNHEALVEETYKLAPMEITWTGMFGSSVNANDVSSEFCFLIVAMKSGLIQFWKVSPSDRRIVSLVHEWDTGLGMLTAMCWQQTSSTAGFLMVGTWKGILAFLPIGIQIAPDQEPTVTVKSMCKVWDEEDSVAVDYIAILKIALRKYVVICAKLHALVGCEISLTEDSIIIRNVGHSFGLHRLPITAMTVMDARSIPQYRVLISTMEGALIEIKVSLGTDEIKFQHEKIPVDLDLKNNMVQGLAISSNGLLCAAILNTSVYYDHLQKKEPLQFAMFVTRPAEDIYSKLRSVLKPQFSFLPSAAHTIAEHADYLDFLRMQLASSATLPAWMVDFFINSQSLENTSQMELYFMRFLLQAHVSGLAVNSKIKGKLEPRLYIVESMIMRNYISKIFNRCQDNLDLLSPAQSQSLLLMADWLLKEFQMPVEGLYSALGCDTPSKDVPSREICDICKAKVPLDNMKTGMCSKGHQFARCCQSLLLCDVVPYNTCASCKSVALKDVWNYTIMCTFCGMAME